MNEKQKLFRRFLPLFFTVLILSVTFRICALFIDFNTETIYFDGKILISFANWIAGIGSLLLVTYAFFADKKTALIASFSTPATYVPTLLLSISLIFFCTESFATLRGFGMTFKEAVTQKNAVYIILTLLAILALLSIGYFLMNALVLTRASVARAGFGITAVIFFALYSTYLYFSTELPINSPNKTVDQMAFLFTALFFLYEIRISLGRECWHLYISFGFVSATLAAFSSIPSLIYYFAKGITVSDSIHESVLTLCIFIFVFSRLMLAGSLKEDKISDAVLIMKNAALQRSEYVQAKEEIARLAYLEVFGRMSENSEISDEKSEKEIFGAETDANGANGQISFPDEIFNVTAGKGNTEASETDASADGLNADNSGIDITADNAPIDNANITDAYTDNAQIPDAYTDATADVAVSDVGEDGYIASADAIGNAFNDTDAEDHGASNASDIENVAPATEEGNGDSGSKQTPSDISDADQDTKNTAPKSGDEQP